MTQCLPQIRPRSPMGSRQLSPDPHHRHTAEEMMLRQPGQEDKHVTLA